MYKNVHIDAYNYVGCMLAAAPFSVREVWKFLGLLGRKQVAGALLRLLRYAPAGSFGQLLADPGKLQAADKLQKRGLNKKDNLSRDTE